MTEEERRAAEIRSIMRLSGIEEPKAEKKPANKKQAKGEEK